jgi:hypothetical protein
MMGWPAWLELGASGGLEIFLTVSTVNEDPMIQFLDPSTNDPIMIERLVSFQTACFDPADPLRITFHGQSADRVLKMRSENGMSGFWVCLQKYVDLVSIPGKMRTFMVVEKRRIANKDLSMPVLAGPREAGIDRHNSVPGPISTPLTCSHNRVASISDFAAVFPEGCFDGTKTSIVDIDISDCILFDLWCHVLRVDLSDRKRSDFGVIQKEWQEIRKCQWDRHASFRKVVRTLETLLPGVTPQSPPLSRLPFDVLMSRTFFEV